LRQAGSPFPDLLEAFHCFAKGGDVVDAIVKYVNRKFSYLSKSVYKLITSLILDKFVASACLYDDIGDIGKFDRFHHWHVGAFCLAGISIILISFVYAYSKRVGRYSHCAKSSKAEVTASPEVAERHSADKGEEVEGRVCTVNISSEAVKPVPHRVEDMCRRNTAQAEGAVHY